MVAEVTQIGDRLDAAEGRGAELGQARAAWDERFNGLQEILQRFRQAEFDSQRSMFPLQLDAHDLVEQYIAGRVTAQQAWTALQQSQRFAPVWHEQQGQGPQFGDVTAGDVSMVLLRVLGEVAGAALRHSAGRGMQRRAPMRRQTRQATGRPQFPNRGFTNGRGF